VAFAHRHGERGIFATLTLFALTPIFAIARTLKLDDRAKSKPANTADCEQGKPVLKQM
jgi:hypothetical protein